jgi:hypothetical protein
VENAKYVSTEITQEDGEKVKEQAIQWNLRILKFKDFRRNSNGHDL